MSITYESAPGETPPPVPAGPRLCNGRDMRVLHNAFLWAYTEAPGWIRSTPAGDTQHSGFVGQVLADLDATLHVHHEGEDELLWDKLEQRAPACALHVGQMREQHARVAALLERATPLLADWRTTADPSLGGRLAGAYEEMAAVLRIHLRREVVEIVPVAEKVITEEEWQSLADHGTAAIPKSRLLPQLGMLLANASPEDRREFVAVIPVPIRWLYRLVGRRQYARLYRRLYPGRPVPETI